MTVSGSIASLLGNCRSGDRNVEFRTRATVDSTCFYGGREQMVLWENGDGELDAFTKSVSECRFRLRGDEAWGQRGVRSIRLDHSHATLYTGEIFDN